VLTDHQSACLPLNTLVTPFPNAGNLLGPDLHRGTRLPGPEPYDELLRAMTCPYRTGQATGRAGG
jgi:hypothetical protein